MIEIVHRRICDECGRFNDETMRYYYGCEPAIPTLPEGWRMIEQKVYCDRHIITVEVKKARK